MRDRIWAQNVRPAGDNTPGRIDEDHPSLLTAECHREDLESHVDDPTYEEDVTGYRAAFRANDMFDGAYESFFYYRDAIDPCRAPKYDGFRLPDGASPYERAAAASAVNDQLNYAVAVMSAELQDYIEEDFVGPGRHEMINALVELREVQELLALPVGIDCGDEACIADEEALDAQLRMMELAGLLQEAMRTGVYARNWQACLVQAVKFRVDLSLLRLDAVCPNHPVTLRTRQAQAIGLQLVEAQNDIAGALDFFRDRSTQCLAIDTYNTCLVPAYPEMNEPHEYPDYCEDKYADSQDPPPEDPNDAEDPNGNVPDPDADAGGAPDGNDPNSPDAAGAPNGDDPNPNPPDAGMANGNDPNGGDPNANAPDAGMANGNDPNANPPDAGF